MTNEHLDRAKRLRNDLRAQLDAKNQAIANGENQRTQAMLRAAQCEKDMVEARKLNADIIAAELHNVAILRSMPTSPHVIAQALDDARLRVSQVADAVTSIKAAHANLVAEIAALDAEIASIAQAIIATRWEALADEILTVYAENAARISALRRMMVNPMDLPMNQTMPQLSSAVEQALSLIPEASVLDTPVNRITLGGAAFTADYAAMLSAFFQTKPRSPG